MISMFAHQIFLISVLVSLAMNLHRYLIIYTIISIFAHRYIRYAALFFSSEACSNSMPASTEMDEVEGGCTRRPSSLLTSEKLNVRERDECAVR
jgi:hypothetical protein